VCHSLVLGCGAVGLFSINYFRKKKIKKILPNPRGGG
jgi:hypothetical protein